MESMNKRDNTLMHINHLHPLKLVASPEPKPICHACNMPCAHQSFGCVQCRYFLHITCATTNRSLNHPAHPAHTLAFELTPSYPHGQFGCNACGEDGNTFSLSCKGCEFDLHLHCAAIPQQIKYRSHRHPLLLVYANPYPPASGTEAYCNSCKKNLDVSKWFYLCRKCDFGGHVGCFYPEAEVLSPSLRMPVEPPPPQQPHGASGSAMNAMQDMQRQMMQAQAQLNSSMMFANTMSNAGQDISSLFDNVRYVRRWI